MPRKQVTAMAGNTPATLKAFFSTDSKPVTMREMNEFWKSLSDDEKDYFRSADISS